MQGIIKQLQSGKKEAKGSARTEKLRYSQYYEHDGALRAYANRTLILAVFSVTGFLLALAFAVYVRLQPPLVIKVDGIGHSSVVTAVGDPKQEAPHQGDQEPSEIERVAFIRLFLGQYLDFSPTNVGRNWAEALNMMTRNLRENAFARMQKENLVGKIKENQTRSECELRSIEATKGEPLTYTAFAVRQIHHMHGGIETLDKVVSEIQIRLVVEGRSERNPSGLLIAEYWEKPIEGEARTPVIDVAPLAAPTQGLQGTTLVKP